MLPSNMSRRDLFALSVALTDIAIREAIKTWKSYPISASAVYGCPLRTWNTSLVTIIDSLFSWMELIDKDFSDWDV
jgi:hypothetical protein